MTPFQLKIFQQNLLDWFNTYQRTLPWREHYEPYAVWISEIMLQQTQVITVLPYYQKWMDTLPTIQALADASEDTVLKLWEGLGYYSRARNLRKTAQIICQDHDGQFPEDFKTILSLPGIGRYTAGAIASIAFNQDRPIVDGNVVRVLCRLMDFRDNPKSTEMVEKFWQLAEAWIPKGYARNFNQGMMELGATVCLKSQPSCLLCPVQEFCQSLAAGTTDQVPVTVKRAPLKMISTALAVIHKGNQVLIQKRPSEGLMGGLWEFPNMSVTDQTDIETSLREGIRELTNIQFTIDQPLPTIKHGYTSFKVTLHCFEGTYQKGRLKAATEGSTRRWVKIKDLATYSFPAAHNKVIRHLQEG